MKITIDYKATEIYDDPVIQKAADLSYVGGFLKTFGDLMLVSALGGEYAADRFMEFFKTYTQTSMQGNTTVTIEKE